MQRRLLDQTFQRADSAEDSLAMITTPDFQNKVSAMLADQSSHQVKIVIQKHPSGTLEVGLNSLTDFELSA